MDIQMNLEQKQALSQRMIQSAQILQMSAQELETYVRDTALENPVIDITEHAPASTEAEQRLQTYQWLNALDEQNRYYYQQDTTDQENSGDDWNIAADVEETLADYLWSQMIASDFSGLEREILEYLLESLDSRGYMPESTAETASRFEVSEDEVLRLLGLLQQLDPAGICARNLQECLTLQLERADIHIPELTAIITDHLDQVAKNQLPAIAKELKLPLDQVSHCCQIIRKLNPKPGNSFCSREQLCYIVPDVTIVKFEDYYEILLNEYLYPDIQVNGYYKQMSKDQNQPEVTEYLQGKIKQAEWVKECIAQRNFTLMNVTKQLLHCQEDFFAKGNPYLKPLKLKDVSGELGIHESTVSRAVRNKYLQCVWGIFPMNFFFSKGISSSEGGEDMASSQVKQALTAVIAEESKKKPLSDRAISEKLAAQGIKLSRRTVAKYRQELGIGDASSRKEY